MMEWRKCPLLNTQSMLPTAPRRCPSAGRNFPRLMLFRLTGTAIPCILPGRLLPRNDYSQKATVKSVLPACGRSSTAERQFPKLKVDGSSPFARSHNRRNAIRCHTRHECLAFMPSQNRQLAYPHVRRVLRMPAHTLKASRSSGCGVFVCHASTVLNYAALSRSGDQGRGRHKRGCVSLRVQQVSR